MKSQTFISASTLLLFLFLFALGGCGQPDPELELDTSTIEKDTTWQGIITIKGDILIPPGVTLTIAPGTVIKFARITAESDKNMFGTDSPYYPQAEIIIRGTLLARGTQEKNIVFTSTATDARASDWGALNFLGSTGNVIEHAKIFFAYNGIHAHGSVILVKDCEIAKNGVGISFKREEETLDAPWYGISSDLTIIGNLIHSNKGGIGLRNSTARISRNIIRDNKFFGIFPKDEGKGEISGNEITNNKKGVYLYQSRGLVLTSNNIYDNKDYNIGVAEAQDFEFDARNNWFGTINREKISDMIFDRLDDPELAQVLFEPFLEKPVRIENSK